MEVVDGVDDARGRPDDCSVIVLVLAPGDHGSWIAASDDHDFPVHLAIELNFHEVDEFVDIFKSLRGVQPLQVARAPVLEGLRCAIVPVLECDKNAAFILSVLHGGTTGIRRAASPLATNVNNQWSIFFIELIFIEPVSELEPSVDGVIEVIQPRRKQLRIRPSLQFEIESCLVLSRERISQSTFCCGSCQVEEQNGG